MPRLAPAARLLQQCEFCFMSECKDVHLQTCSKCKRVYYCSRECQKAHWPTHKLQCQQNYETIKALADSPTPNLKPLEKAFRNWVMQFRAVLSDALVNSLELHRNPDHVLTHVLLVWLTPKFSDDNTPRRDVEIRHGFKVFEILVAPVDVVLQHYDEPMRSHIASGIATKRAETMEMRELLPDVVGNMVLLLTSGPLMRFVPYTMPTSIYELPKWDPHWKETLMRKVDRGDVD